MKDSKLVPPTVTFALCSNKLQTTDPPTRPDPPMTRMFLFSMLSNVIADGNFVDIGVEVYKGMVVGERNKPGDLDVNIVREKKLTNMRSASKDNTVVLRPPQVMSLDKCIEFIAEDELIEITPQNLRIRKMELDINKRISINKKK